MEMDCKGCAEDVDQQGQQPVTVTASGNRSENEKPVITSLPVLSSLSIFITHLLLISPV